MRQGCAPRATLARGKDAAGLEARIPDVAAYPGGAGVPGCPAAWVGGAAVGSGKRVRWGPGRRAHVSPGGTAPGAAELSGGGRMRGVPSRRFGGGVGWGLATFTSRALTRSSGGNTPAVSETVLEGRAGGVLLRALRRDWGV